MVIPQPQYLITNYLNKSPVSLFQPPRCSAQEDQSGNQLLQQKKTHSDVPVESPDDFRSLTSGRTNAYKFAMRYK